MAHYVTLDDDQAPESGSTTRILLPGEEGDGVSDPGHVPSTETETDSKNHSDVVYTTPTDVVTTIGGPNDADRKSGNHSNARSRIKSSDGDKDGREPNGDAVSFRVSSPNGEVVNVSYDPNCDSDTSKTDKGPLFHDSKFYNTRDSRYKSKENQRQTSEELQLEEYKEEAKRDAAGKSVCSFLCCCCNKLGRVSPDEEDLENVVRNMEKQFERAPPEGRDLYLEDDIRRIDYILTWKESEQRTQKNIEMELFRKVFERNLEEEGLEIEYDIKEGREEQFVKVHAPWKLLTRYAEILKIRMPMKEIPKELKSESLWAVMTDYLATLMSPFELDPQKVPPLPKRFTCVFQKDKEYLFAIPEDKKLFFPNTIRSVMVDYILRRKRYNDDEAATFDFGISRLLTNDVYTAAYPLHEGNWKTGSKPNARELLYSNWAYWKKFFKVQPLDYVRSYFGEKIALYFAWLGFYTWALIPVSLIGLIVFIYGCSTIYTNTVGKETCDWNNNFTMCPLCDSIGDEECPYWNYASTCDTVRASHIFDNGATVFFAVVMSLWGVFFLEFWKRKQATIQWQWNMTNFEEEEETPRPDYLVRLANSKYKKKHKVTGVQEPYFPFWRRQVPVYLISVSTMFFLVVVAIAILFGVFVYRMAVKAALYFHDNDMLNQNASSISSVTAAIINLIMIFILNFIYSRVAVKLTDLECARTQSEYDSSLTFKLYLLQFINYYTSIFYMAFFKGRFTGRPGDYNTMFGFRQEECSAGGCLMEVCIQLAIIFVGKQICQNVFMKIIIPGVISCCRSEEEADEKQTPWEKDFELKELGRRGLYDEYLEMMLQFGFVTIFVAIFPLAPMFAFINNMLELRLDAGKFVCDIRRPMAARAQSIGVWYNILYGISRLSIVTNAFLIAFTSGFIHRLVYQYQYSPDDSTRGFVNFSLSYFNVSDFEPDSSPSIPPENNLCRYTDYREPPWSPDRYEYTSVFWHVLAAQFIFVVVFQNVVVILTDMISFIIPDVPTSLEEQIRREAYLTNQLLIQTELKAAKGDRNTAASTPLESYFSFLEEEENGSKRDFSQDDTSV